MSPAEETPAPASQKMDTIPVVSGLPIDEAMQTVSEAGFYPKRKRQIRDIPGAPVVENGHAIATNPPEGSQIPHASQVIVYSKVNRLLFLSSLAAALAVFIALVIVLITLLSPDNLVEKPEVEAPKAPDESQAVREGGSGSRVGGILVVPTYFKERTSLGSEIRPVEVQNNSARERKMNFYFVPLAGNTPEGVPELKLTRKTLQEGKKYVALDKTKATVKPGEKTTVRMRVVRQPESPEYYGALLVELGREDKSPYSEPIKNGVRLSINNIFQITAVRVLQFSDGKEDGRVQRVRGFQDEEQNGIGFTARVQNTGEVIAGPEGSIAVFDANGDLVRRLPLEGAQGIIPGDNRETVVLNREVVKNLDPGGYTAQADVVMGGRESRARWEFEVDENGKLPTPAMLAEADARPYRPGTGQPFAIDVEILNTGTATYSPRLDIKIVPFGENEVIQEQQAELGSVSPDGRVRGTFDFEGIDEIGNYEFVAEVSSDDGTYLGQIVQSVLVDEEKFEEPSLDIKFRDWMSAHPLETMLLGAALIILLLGGAVAMWNWLSKRKRA